MTSTCGGIRRGRAEGQYLFKLITMGWRGCVYACVHAYLYIQRLVHSAHATGKSTCERQICANARSGDCQRTESKHAHLRRCSARAVVCVAPECSVLNGLQLLLRVINIPAVEILACTGKHDKTATHLSLFLPCSQHRLSFVCDVLAPPGRLKTSSVAPARF